jgi:hypothetical protein
MGVGTWLIATAGGLGLLLLLSRRKLEMPGAALAAPRHETDPAAWHTPHPITSHDRGEEGMPRWLRPSVQAARNAQTDTRRLRGGG